MGGRKAGGTAADDENGTVHCFDSCAAAIALGFT
jgi:hypothetical protein